MTFTNTVKCIKYVRHMVALLILLALAACGGGSSSTFQDAVSSKYTLATLKINLTGTLPTDTGISGADITITLPPNVKPALIGESVVSGVVSLSGTFSGGNQTEPVYTPPFGNVPGTLRFILASAPPAGVVEVSEVATITLQLVNNAVPTVADFPISAVVYDAAIYDQISGMGAIIAGVNLQ